LLRANREGKYQVDAQQESEARHVASGQGI
jgi:hypothetical protein